MLTFPLEVEGQQQDTVKNSWHSVISVHCVRETAKLTHTLKYSLIYCVHASVHPHRALKTNILVLSFPILREVSLPQAFISVYHSQIQ